MSKKKKPPYTVNPEPKKKEPERKLYIISRVVKVLAYLPENPSYDVLKNVMARSLSQSFAEEDVAIKIEKEPKNESDLKEMIQNGWEIDHPPFTESDFGGPKPNVKDILKWNKD